MEEQQKNKMFYDELAKLLKAKYISNKEYIKVSSAYTKYYKKNEPTTVSAVRKVTSTDLVKPPTVKVKKELTQQDIREKNITIVLIVGVILVLLSGLVLATSNWSIMSDLLKTSLIMFVSILFFAISLVSDRILNINKTSFAFWVLGSLFLPVALLSAGFFKLFGEWLSIGGEGGFVLGSIGAIICLPLYFYSSVRYKNRFFVWMSYITVNIGVYNFIAVFKPQPSIFVLIIVMYNSLLFLMYSKFKHLKNFSLFTNQLNSFSQINLMVSSIFSSMYLTTQGVQSIVNILIYLVISFNFIYLSYSYNRKEYNFAAPFFIVVTAVEFSKTVQLMFEYNINALSLFIVALILFFLVYRRNYSKYLCNLRLSSGITSYFLLYISAAVSIDNEQWWSAAFVMCFSNVMLYMINNRDEEDIKVKVASYSMPINILLGSFAVYGALEQVLMNSAYDLAYHFGVCVFVLFMLNIIWDKFNHTIANAYFIVSHVVMPFAVLILFIVHYDNPIVFIIAAVMYLYAALTRDKEIIKRIFLYAAILLASLSLWSLFDVLNLVQQQNYVMLMVTVLVTVFWYICEDAWKNRIVPFLLVYSVIGSLLFNDMAILQITDFLPAMIYILIIGFVLHSENLDKLLFLPLLLLLQMIVIFDNDTVLEYPTIRMSIMLAIAVVLRIIGQKFYKVLYMTSAHPTRIVAINWYSIFSFVLPVLVLGNWYGDSTKWYHLIALVMITGLIFSQRNAVVQGKPRKIVLTAAILSSILPYYKLIDNLQVYSIIVTELKLLALIAAVTVLANKLWTDSQKQIDWMKRINAFVIVLSAFILLKDVAMDNYLADRLILGILSLVAIIIGMQLKQKIYLSTGIIALACNILIQTKQLWLSIPWWGYLLIAGLMLIGLASYNEKRKNNDKVILKDQDENQS